MGTREAALVQTLLEGVPLPATKQQLIAYAARQDEDAATKLEPIPDREYRSLDEVREALSPVQPSPPRPEPELPHEESDLPPGGDDYTRPRPDPGAVRPNAPPRTPPQQVTEKQAKTQKEQQRKQNAAAGE
jgi:Protein of unknown function (DUF2795)